MNIVEFVDKFFAELIEIFNMMSPFLLLGFLIAGVMKVWFPKRWIVKYMSGGNLKSIINTSLIGIPLPLCSCGVIPTSVALYRNGASKGASIGFLISTPHTGIDSNFVTFVLLGLPFALIRILTAFIMGVVGGMLTSKYGNKKGEAIEDIHYNHQHGSPCRNPILETFRYGFYEFLTDISGWLLQGIFIAALLATIIPDDLFTHYITNDIVSMLVILIVSLPLYLCATGSIPIAAILIAKGLSPGAALIFLIVGAATNMAAINVVRRVFGTKTLLIYLGSIIVGSLVIGLAMDYLMPSQWFSVVGLNTNFAGHIHTEHCHHHTDIWSVICSATLITLIFVGYIVKYISKRHSSAECSCGCGCGCHDIIMSKNHQHASVLNKSRSLSDCDFTKLKLYKQH